MIGLLDSKMKFNNCLNTQRVKRLSNQNSFKEYRTFPKRALHIKIIIYNVTSLKIAGSIPDEVIGFYNRPNISSCPVALGMTHPLTEMGARNLPGG
jgi:hypothetical protein